jgi:DNA segregation ATPase FtsK/SpoIIIE, S-DNA-T family
VGGFAIAAHRSPTLEGNATMAIRKSSSDTVPVGPTLSMFDPVYLGIDEAGTPVYLPMMYNNLLLGGVPGSGKSATISLIVAHAALSLDCRLCLIDGKQVELGLWKDVADVFVGPDIDHAIATLRRLQTVMDNRYSFLMAQHRRKIERGDEMNAIVLVVDICRPGNYADSLNRPVPWG